MNRAHVTLLLALFGFILSVSAYSDKSIYSQEAPARLRRPVQRPKSDHRQAARIEAPAAYQVQLQPVAVVAQQQQEHKKPAAAPAYEHRVPLPIFRPPPALLHPSTPAPTKSIHFQPAYLTQTVPKVEISAPAPPPQQPPYQSAFLFPTIQPAKIESAPAYGNGDEKAPSDNGDQRGDGGDDDDEDDDNGGDNGDSKKQQPVAFTYPAFDGYKAPQVYQEIAQPAVVAAPQPAYQVLAFQAAARPALQYPQFTLEESKPAAAQDSDDDDEESYPDDLSAIPGQPGHDYPQLSRIPEIHFSCDDKHPGYYADVDYKCQVWHSCDTHGRRQSFLCPNGTIYSQEKFVCDWWFNVDCSRSSSFVGLNEDLYKVPEKQEVVAAPAQPVYGGYEQQQPHYTVATVVVPQQQQQIHYEAAPLKVQHHQTIKHQPRPAPQQQPQYIKSSQLQQQQTSYY